MAIILSLLSLFTTEFINDDTFLSIKTFNTVNIIKRASQKIILSTKSNYNNLGQIKINFDKPNFSNQLFVFRLFQMPDKQAIYTATHRLSDIALLNKYPFGFPPIQNSKDQEYLIELSPAQDTETLRLNIKVEGKKPLLELQYPFSRNQLLKVQNAIQFMAGKVNQYLLSAYYRKSLLFYFSPLFFTFIYLFLRYFIPINVQRKLILKEIVEIIKPFFFILFLLSILFSLFLKTISDNLLIVIISLFTVLLIAYNYEYEKYFLYSLGHLLFCILLTSSNLNVQAENTAIFAYIYFSSGVLIGVLCMSQQARIIKNNISKKLQFIIEADTRISRLLVRVYDYMNTSPINTIKVGVTIFSVIVILIFILISYAKIMSFRDRQLKNPRITIMEPVLVYHSTKVVLYGKSFGEKKDERYRIMRNGKEIRTDYWDDSKIIFTIPLEWKPGEYSIWIERPIEWNTETIIEKTKPQTIKVLPVTGKITPDDDLYFKQMNTLRKETKEINGF